MKSRKIREMIRAKGRIERGAVMPAKVWEVQPDGHGGFTQREVDPRVFQWSQKATHQNFHHGLTTDD